MQTLSSWYHDRSATGKLSFDQAQFELLNELDNYLKNLETLNFITRLWRKDHKLGYYIYGDVGRGKSMIMNLMFQFTKTERKVRLHFHEFMQQIQEKMMHLHDINDPLALISKDLKKDYDIIYLDEIHVSDIATAMIMKRLLESLFANRINIVTSSNYHPDGLWPNGLLRERFLPAIEVIKDRLKVVSLNSKQDYRLINNSINELFIINDIHSNDRLNEIFSSINLDHTSKENSQIEVYGRQVKFIKEGKDVIWFDFSVICGDKRSQLDYLELIKKYKWFIISDIFMLNADKKDVARRFTWLIDILYDNSRKLSLSSSVLIKDIYSTGDFANEFERTISRLEEMQTKEYLQKDLTAKPV